MAGRHSRQIDNVSADIASRRMAEQQRRPRASKGARAPRHVAQVSPGPRPRSMESDRVYTQRIKRGSYRMEGAKRKQKKHWLVALVVIIAALIIACFIGVQVYMKSTNSRLDIGDSEIAPLLVSPHEGDPFYMLCTADLNDPSYSYSSSEDDAVMIVRVDQTSKAVCFVSVPSHVELQLPSGEKCDAGKIAGIYGYATLLEAVKGFAGVDFSHLVATDFRSLKKLVERIGGVDVNVPQEIDDPAVGNVVIRAGENLLDGAASLELLRATNLQGGFGTVSTNRVLFTEALIAKVLDSNQVELASVLSDAADYVGTDWTSQAILSTADSFKPYDSITFYHAAVPCSVSNSNGKLSYSCIDSEWKEMMEAVAKGENPEKAEKSAKKASESKITIEVRNGAGIDGAAATLAAILKQKGYKIKDVGNTNDDTIYPETLVVYTGTGSNDDAETVIRDIGAGRVVEGGDFYSSKADVIVIIGADWA